MSGIGLKHLLKGTCFAISGIALDEASVSLGCFDVVPDLYIVDGSDPSRQTAESAGRLKERSPESRVVMIADEFDPGFVLAASDAGVDGFCLSGSGREVLVKSLELIMLGEAMLPFSVVSSVLNGISVRPVWERAESGAEARPEPSDPRMQKLSTREVEILSCLVQGAPNKAIARTFNIAEATVKVHVKAILRRIGVLNRTQAAIWAMEHLPVRVEPPSEGLSNNGRDRVV